MKTSHYASTLIATALVLLSSLPAQAQYPISEDVSSPEAIVQATYASIQRAPGEEFRWDRFRSLFLADAVLIPNTEQRQGEFTVMSPDEFVSWISQGTTIGGPNDRGFQEMEAHSVVHRYGDVAQVFSTYEKHFWEDDRVLGRGINSFQLVQNGGRWWIASIVWDEETGAGPIPEEYTGK